MTEFPSQDSLKEKIFTLRAWHVAVGERCRLEEKRARASWKRAEHADLAQFHEEASVVLTLAMRAVPHETVT